MHQAGLDKDKNVGWCPDGSESEGGLTCTTKHLFTKKIAELSAKFCLNLIAHATPESAGSLLSEPTEIAVRPIRPADEFMHSDDYCDVEFRGRRYQLTQLAGTIVKALRSSKRIRAFQRKGSDGWRTVTMCGMRSADAMAGDFGVT
jgi:hypothetical protein